MASFGPAPLPSLEKPDRFAELLKKIEEMIEDAIMAAREDQDPSETYELVQQYMSSPTFTEYIQEYYSLFVIPEGIFEVQSASAYGDGIYNCYRQNIRASEWYDQDGHDKLTDRIATSFEVFNLLENDCIADYTPGLGKYDRLITWQMRDNGGTLRWIGLPMVSSVRWVKTTEVTPATTNITCNLMLNNGVEAQSGSPNELGYNIEVYAELASGLNLDDVIPQLQNGQWYPAHNVQGKWWFLQKFDQTGVLRIAKIKSLNTDHYNCRLLAKDKSTELGAADINVYPVEHLGSNALNSSPATIWPDLAVNDFISVYYDIDGVWRTPIIVDDTTSCD